MSYFSEYLEGKTLRKAILRYNKRLKDISFDSFAVTGNSGLLVAAPLALKMNKNLLIVRKDSDYKYCHSGNQIEGFQRGKEKIIILDDFVETGKTIIDIVTKLNKFCIEPEILGIFLYKTFDCNCKSVECNRPVSLFNREGIKLPIFTPFINTPHPN